MILIKSVSVIGNSISRRNTSSWRINFEIVIDHKCASGCRVVSSYSNTHLYTNNVKHERTSNFTIKYIIEGKGIKMPPGMKSWKN
jgi:hypothetical protein